MAANVISTTMQAVSLMETIFRSFRSVKLAKSFLKDFNSCLIQLDLSCLRLMTWYRCRSSEGPINDEGTLKSLGNIREAFASAEAMYNDYDRQKPEDVEAQWKTTRKIQDGTCEAAVQLHERIQERIDLQSTSIKRSQIFFWLLYQREEFENIVKTTVSMINQLVTDFPPTQKNVIDKQRHELVESIRGSEQLKILEEASRDVDNELQAVVSHKLSGFDCEFDRVNASGEKMVVGYDFSERPQLPDGKIPRQRFKEVESSGKYNVIGTKF